MSYEQVRQQGYPSPHLISYRIANPDPKTTPGVPVQKLAQCPVPWRQIVGYSECIATNPHQTMRVSFNPASSNAQLGPIPASTTEPKSCPATCPLKDVCYAKFHFQGHQWRKVSERGMEWEEFLSKVRRIAPGALWRHNVSGDLPADAEGNINVEDVRGLVLANRRRKGYTYTHHVLNSENLAIIKEANANGFTISASCESVEDADKVMTEHGIPAVAVINSEESRRFFTTTNGRKVVVCPAKIHDNVNCASCGLCQKADRTVIVAFPAHGTAKKKTNGIVSNH